MKLQLDLQHVVHLLVFGKSGVHGHHVLRYVEVALRQLEAGHVQAKNMDVLAIIRQQQQKHNPVIEMFALLVQNVVRP